MRDQDNFYTALKFHFFPRLLTPWDLNRIMNASSLPIDTISDDNFIELEMGEGMERLMNSALLKLQSVYKYEEESKHLVKERLENWLFTQKQGIKALVEIGKKEIAIRLALRLVTFIGYLITKYVSSESLPAKLEKLLGEVKFTKGCFSPLVSFLNDLDWQKLLKELDFHAEFYVLLSANLYNISKSTEEQKIRESLEELLAYKDNLDTYIDSTVENLDNYYSVKALQLASIMGIWEEETGKRKKAKILQKIAQNLYETENKDSINEILGDLFSATSSIIQGKNNLFTKFQHIGEKLIDEKLKIVGMTEKLALDIPPTILATIGSYPSPNIDIFGELDPETVPHLNSETSRRVANWSSEVKFLLFPLLGKNPNTVKELEKIVKDPRASLACLLLVGPLFPQIIDTITICHKRDCPKEGVNTLIQLTAQIFREEVKLLRELEGKTENPYFSRILDFFATREVFWTEFRFFSEKVKERIKKYQAGSDLLEVFSELRELTDVTPPSPVRGRRGEEIPERIKDMYI